MALSELIGPYDVLNTGRININNWYSGSTFIWSSSTGTYSVIRTNPNENLGNDALGFNSIAAGVSNRASTNFSAALLGSGNTATTLFTSVLTGRNNKASSKSSVILGGFANIVSASSSYYSLILNGNSNIVKDVSKYSTIINGKSNSVYSNYSTIAAGKTNSIGGTSSYGFIGGGKQQSLNNSTYSLINGGIQNTITTSDATSSSLTIIGGSGNTISSPYGITHSIIAGGQSNSISLVAAGTLSRSAIIGGFKNLVRSNNSAIVGGSGNTISTGSEYSFIGGGQSNTVSNNHGAILGGIGCEAAHTYSIAIGGGAKTRANFDLVLGATATSTPSTANNTIRLQGTGGNILIDGSVSSPEADYAELFEWKDGNKNNEERFGYFVSLDEDKITIGNENIIGIISSTPSVIGDAHPNRWNGTYLKDEWGKKINVNYKKHTWNENFKNITVYEDENNNKFSEYPNVSNLTGIIYDGNISKSAKNRIDSISKIKSGFYCR